MEVEPRQGIGGYVETGLNNILKRYV
jgi:hypothetical protein